MNASRLLRMLWKFRAANGVTVATLAATVAVLLATIAVAHNFFVSPWTYDTQRLGVLTHHSRDQAREAYGFRASEFRALRDSGLFEHVSANSGRPVALEGPDGYPSRVMLMRTLPEARLVGATEPLLGRFIDDTDAAGAASGAVIAYDLWQSHYDGAPDVLGRALRVEDAVYTIVGVMPDRFAFGGGDIWVAHERDLETDQGDARDLVVNVLLKPGTSLQDLRAPLAAIAQRLVAEAPDAHYPEGWGIDGKRVIDAVMGPMRPAVILLVAASILMLVIVLANVATLLNVRQVAMEPQLALQLALGATTRRLHAEAFASNLVLAAIGVGLGWALGGVVFERIVGMISNDWIPRELEGNFRYTGASLRWMPLVVLACAAVMTLSQWPRLRRIEPQAAVRGSARTGASRAVLRGIRGLAAVQVAAATLVGILAVCVGVGGTGVRARDLGMRTDDVLATRLTLPQATYADAAARLGFARRLQAGLAGHPDVEQAAFVSAAPFQRYRRQGIVRTDGSAGPVEVSARVNGSLGPLPAVLGLSLVQGRYLDDAVDIETAPAVAVVSRTLAERLWGGGDVIGKSLRLSDSDGVSRHVVGVLEDARFDGALAEPEPLLFIPQAQDEALPSTLVVLARGYGARAPAVEPLAREVAALDPRVPLYDSARLADRAHESVAALTLAEAIFLVFAVLAGSLAMMGTGVVMRFLLEVRRREFAVRSALGAPPRRLFLGVLAEGIRIGALGALLGATASWFAATTVSASLYGATPWQFRVAAAVIAVLLLVVALAALQPARRAALSDPAMALRGG